MRIGIIGTGSMGHAHAPSWQYLKEIGAELVGVVANRAGTAEAFAEKYGIKAYTSYEALLQDVDIVDLCVPTNLHREMTVAAAQAGKHVICEKPIALTIEDAKTMIAVCKQAGVRLFIAHVLRFVAPYSAAKAAIAAGHLGNLGVMRLKRVGYQPRKAVDNWFIDESRSGGMMLDLMIHDYDYARWLAGDVSRVFAKSVRAARPDAPGDYALVTLRFANGTIAHIEGGWAYPPGFFRTSMDIAGTGGVIEWSSDDSETFQYHLADAPQAEIAEVAVPLSAAADSPFTAQLRHFYEAIQTGAETLVTAADGLAALQIGLAARESARTGKSVTIEAEVI
jgi:myo-inositol 2-dehydrogenase / D-chiro-inositol 1-dehydrogenase